MDGSSSDSDMGSGDSSHVDSTDQSETSKVERSDKDSAYITRRSMTTRSQSRSSMQSSTDASSTNDSENVSSTTTNSTGSTMSSSSNVSSHFINLFHFNFIHSKKRFKTFSQYLQSKRKQLKPKRRRTVDEEIKHVQCITDLLIPRQPFHRLVREIVQAAKKDARMQKDAFEAIQECAEMFLVQIFQDAFLLAAHRKCRTVQPNDVQLLMYIRGDPAFCFQLEKN